MILPEIVEWVARTTLAVLALGIILSIYRNRLAASIQFSFWLCCGGLIVGSFFAAELVPELNIIPRFGESELRDLSRLNSGSELPEPAGIETSLMNGIESANGENAIARGVSVSVMGWVWAIGTVVLLIRLTASYFYLNRQAKNLPFAHPAWAMLENLKREFGIRKPARLVGKNGSPMTWGFTRPTISLPAEGEGWNEQRLKIVLQHELAHIARNDAFWLLVSQVTLSFFWFHPGLWFIGSRLREAREQAADALVIRQGISGADYAEVILSFMRIPRVKGMAVALCGIKSPGAVGNAHRRIRAVLNQRATSNVSPTMRVGLALLVFFSAGVVAISVAAQQVKRSLKTVVVLDAGHGGHDVGGRNSLGMEKDYNLDVTMKVKALLEDEGIEIVLTRSDDRFLQLADRANVANKLPDSIFVSIHHNSHLPGKKVEGVVVYHPGGEDPGKLASSGLADRLLFHVVKSAGPDNRGKQAANFGVLKALLVPGVLIECGYLTHVEESRKIDTEGYRQKMADGIAAGIVDFLANQEREEPIAKRIVPVFDPPLAAIPLADGFDYPVGAPDGRGYYVYRGFESGGHLGEDWNGIGGGNTDFGDRVTSIGNGKIILARDLKEGWGNVIITRHRYLSKEGEEKVVDSLYAHLARIDVKEGDEVTKGQLIGRIGGGPHNMYSAHLHFEIRKNTNIGMERSLFEKSHRNYFSPRAFISANR